MIGIDVLFIGPYDLSLALGYPAPSPDPHPEVEKVIQQILKASHGKKKKWYVSYLIKAMYSESSRCERSAIYCTSGTQSFKRAQEGFDMVCGLYSIYGVQHSMLMRLYQINVTSDKGAMSESLARQLTEAVGGQVGARGFGY